uniref:MfnQ n=1 Tax=Streptomyces drozdowiczii TaxID=202862 RepID=A0A0D4WTQ0_9ACTN|nr:MfnQ [Streptomyces drozdowiczii]
MRLACLTHHVDKLSHAAQFITLAPRYLTHRRAALFIPYTQAVPSVRHRSHIILRDKLKGPSPHAIMASHHLRAVPHLPRGVSVGFRLPCGLLLRPSDGCAGRDGPGRMRVCFQIVRAGMAGMPRGR